MKEFKKLQFVFGIHQGIDIRTPDIETDPESGYESISALNYGLDTEYV